MEELNSETTELASVRGLETRVRQRIAQLQEALAKFVTSANQQVMAYNTAIAELQRLLGEGPLSDAEKGQEQKGPESI